MCLLFKIGDPKKPLLDYLKEDKQLDLRIGQEAVVLEEGTIGKHAVIKNIMVGEKAVEVAVSTRLGKDLVQMKDLQWMAIEES